MIYSINAKLKASFSKDNIQKILKNGSEIGYTYYEYGSEMEFGNLELATEGLMNPNIYDSLGIMVKKDDTIYCLAAGCYKEYFGLVMSGFDINEITIVEGTKQFLTLIKGFALLKLYTIND